MSELPTLYVCHASDKGPPFHPCRKAQAMMHEKGIEFEKVVAGHGNPIPVLRKGSRDELEAATGKKTLPVLKLADGTVIAPSKAIYRWIDAQ